MSPERHVLSRDRIAGRSGKAIAARMRKNPVSLEKRDNYLAILKATNGDMGAALRGSRMSFFKARSGGRTTRTSASRKRSAATP